MALIRDALVFSLLKQEDELGDLYGRTRWMEDQHPGFIPLVISDNLHYLLTGNLRDRDARVKEWGKILSDSPDPFLRPSVKQQLALDEEISARKLLRENRYNHFTSTLNHVSAAFGSLFQGQMQPLVQLPIDLIYACRRMTLSSPRERKSLFLLKRFLWKHPDSEDANYARKKIPALEQKRHKRVLKQEIEFARSSRKKGNLPRALFHYENAAEMEPSSRSLRKKIQKIKSQLALRERRKRESGIVLNGEDFFLSPLEEKDYGGLIYSLAASDHVDLRERCLSFALNHPDSNYKDDVEYARSVILDFQNERREMLESFRSITKKFPGANAARYAAFALENPCLDPLQKLKKAKSRYTRRLWHYILTGNRPAEDQLYIAASGAARYPPAAAENLGVLFIFDVAARGIRSIFTCPVSPEGIIEAASLCERNFPGDPSSQAIQEELARLYSANREYALALRYAKKAGTFSSSYLRKLENKRARRLYLMISGQQDPSLKQSRLQRLIDQYPEAPILKKAKKELQRLAREEICEFRISRSELAAFPEFWINAGVNLDPGLFDGNINNGEISEDGLMGIRQGPVLYRLQGENYSHSLDMNTIHRELIISQLEEFREGLLSARPRTRDKESTDFPVEIAGGVGSRGVEAYPSFLPIRYQGDDLDLFR